MSDTYRGFVIDREGGVFTIRERGKIIDDAASESAAYDRIDAILRLRRAEDQLDQQRNYRR